METYFRISNILGEQCPTSVTTKPETGEDHHTKLRAQSPLGPTRTLTGQVGEKPLPGQGPFRALTLFLVSYPRLDISGFVVSLAWSSK